MDNKRKKLISSMIGIIGSSSFIIGVCFSYAWYANNGSASASNIALIASDYAKMSFSKEVFAQRHFLNGNILSNEYERNEANGTLNIVHSSLYDANTETNEEIDISNIENTSFLFTEMLPREYVDITIKYKLDDIFDQKGYSIILSGFNNNEDNQFVINGHTYDVTGIFKYQIVSPIENASEEKWLTTFSLGVNNAKSMVEIYKDTWIKSEEYFSLTFRIIEDFEQYYNLIEQEGIYVTNLLSNKVLTIGSIVLIPE